MKLEKLKINSSLNKAYLSKNLFIDDINLFKKNYEVLFDVIKSDNNEDTIKRHIIKFLDNTFYDNKFLINSNINSIDLAIYNGKSENSQIGVIIETKAIKNPLEMITLDDINKKGLHELILYYLEERILNNNINIKNLIITNSIDWFIFNATEFERVFVNTGHTPSIQKNFNDWNNKKLASKNKDWFYNEIAKPFIENSDETIFCTHFNLNEFDIEQTEHALSLYKIFSPEHLLKLPFANDSNTLNQDFYNEILHIIGLHETKDNAKKIERLPEKYRNEGSFLENVISVIETEEILQKIENPEQFGETKEEQIFSISLELCLTWINRIIFLKLLESQLLKYNNNNKEFQFLNIDIIKDFDNLRELFFDVLAVNTNERKKNLKEIYKNIPYLNSSLFEQTMLEKEAVKINHIKHTAQIPIFNTTVLKDENGKRKTGLVPILPYLFEFLDSYNFGSSNKIEIQEKNKTLINSSVLGLIFEKLNGYKEGSFFTPGYVTMYICKETIRKAVIQKFNSYSYDKDLNFVKVENLIDLYNQIEKIGIKKANEIFNSVRICDPAVGSGHFLVSALNELLAIKSELGILVDNQGKTFRKTYCVVENDELFVTQNDELFVYDFRDKESQRLQETLFNEKRTLIENCLFGVDINPKSVQICRLRLWIELLKNAYYIIPENATGFQNITRLELETLPNIDINIKCGNSLVSHFLLNGNSKTRMSPQKMQLATNKYKKAVSEYKNATVKYEKQQAEKAINALKEELARYVNPTDRDYIAIGKIAAEIDTQKIFFSKDEQIQWQMKIKRLTKELDEAEKRYSEKKRSVYANAFEWRFEFPEVLDDNGYFIGFDAIIGNPPYIDFREVKKGIINYLSNYKINFKSSKINFYQYFIELGYNLLSKNGILSFINPNQFLTIDAGFGTRKFLVENTQILFINDISYLKVFEKAATYTVVWSFKKTINQNYFIDYNKCKEIENLDKFQSKINIKDVVSSEKLLLISQSNSTIISKIEKDTLKLGTLCNLSWGTSQSGYGKLKILKNDFEKLSKLEKEKYIPILQTRDIKSYHIDWKEEYIPKNIFSQNIIKKFDEPQKILIARMTLKLQAAIDTNKYYVGKSTLLTEINNQLDLLYLLAILNSKLINFWYSNYFENTHMAGGYIRFDIPYVKQIPIKIISLEKQKIFSNLVDKIIEIKKENSKGKTENLEKQIDALVYKLYNISNKEIDVIEK